jgi:hypothetical protein
MRIYLVFYKLLFKLALEDAKLAIEIKLKDYKYKVKRIEGLRKFRH